MHYRAQCIPYTTLLHIIAPSAAPTSLRVSAVNSSSITVQWGTVDCIHHNGGITGYSVRYGPVKSENKHIMNVTGGDVTETTISGLDRLTSYSVEVAAINSASTGIYSNNITVITISSE